MAPAQPLRGGPVPHTSGLCCFPTNRAPWPWGPCTPLFPLPSCCFARTPLDRCLSHLQGPVSGRPHVPLFSAASQTGRRSPRAGLLALMLAAGNKTWWQRWGDRLVSALFEVCFPPVKSQHSVPFRKTNPAARLTLLPAPNRLPYFMKNCPGLGDRPGSNEGTCKGTDKRHSQSSWNYDVISAGTSERS